MQSNDIAINQQTCHHLGQLHGNPIVPQLVPNLQFPTFGLGVVRAIEQLGPSLTGAGAGGGGMPLSANEIYSGLPGSGVGSLGGSIVSELVALALLMG